MNDGSPTVFDATCDDASKIVIGDGHKSENMVEILVTNRGARLNAVLQLSASIGGEESDLAADASAIPSPVFEGNGKSLDMDKISRPDKVLTRWSTLQKGIWFEKDAKFTLRLSGFESKTKPGRAALTLTVSKQTVDGDGAIILQDLFTKPIEIEKQISGTVGPHIHYFMSDTDFIIGGGQKEVSISFLVSGCRTPRLYRNNQIVHEQDKSPAAEDKSGWSRQENKSGPESDIIVGKLLDTPSITTVYRLDVSDTEGDASEVEPQSITVQVLKSGWNQIVQSFGYPVQLFDSPDLEGQGGRMLYGIFRGPDMVARLYASRTGLDGWQLQPGIFPQEMAASPGVAFDRGLWLIGGSSIDLDRASAEVWCYRQDEQRRLSWQEVVLTCPISGAPTTFEPRMGHAVLNVPIKRDDGKIQTQIWVIGGYTNSGSKSFGEVQTIEKNSEGQYALGCRARDVSLERHMHAAAVLQQLHKPTEVVIFGGKNSEQKSMKDMMSTKDGGKTWTEKSLIRPSPGTPLASALITQPGSSGSERVALAGTFTVPDPTTKGDGNLIRSGLYERYDVNERWVERSIGDGWEVFEGRNFHMQGLVFENCIFIWSLDLDDIQNKGNKPPALNVFIP